MDDEKGIVYFMKIYFEHEEFISAEALMRVELYTDALKEMKDMEQWEMNAKENEAIEKE